MNNNHAIKIFISVLAIFGFVSGFACLAQNTLPETLIALPENAGVKCSWVMPPSTSPEFSALKFLRENQNFTFSVDNAKNLWLGFDNRIICMNRQLACELSEPFKHFIHLSNGSMLISTVLHLGFADFVNNDEKIGSSGLPLVPFQPIAKLPETYADIFSGNFQSVIAVSRKNSGSSVHLLEPEAYDYTYKGALQNWKKVFETEKNIDALANRASSIYFTHENMLWEYNTAYNSMYLIALLQKNETIRQLALTLKGIYYATDTHVGIIGKGGYLRIIQAAYPKISVGRGNLYVLFPESMGVMLLENLDKLEAAF